MRHAVVDLALHFDPGFFQRRFEQGAVFAQRVNLGIDDGDRRQACQFGVDQIRTVGRGTVSCPKAIENIAVSRTAIKDNLLIN